MTIRIVTSKHEFAPGERVRKIAKAPVAKVNNIRETRKAKKMARAYFEAALVAQAFDPTQSVIPEDLTDPESETFVMRPAMTPVDLIAALTGLNPEDVVVHGDLAIGTDDPSIVEEIS